MLTLSGLIAVLNCCFCSNVFFTNTPIALSGIADMCWRVEPGKYPPGGPSSEPGPCGVARSLISTSEVLMQAAADLESDYTEDLFLSLCFKKVSDILAVSCFFFW